MEKLGIALFLSLVLPVTSFAAENCRPTKCAKSATPHNQVCTEALQAAKGFNLKETRSLLAQSAVAVLFVLAVIKLSAQSYSPFLYFQF